MAFTGLGGREYYNNARGLSSGGGGVATHEMSDSTTGGITNCVGIGRVKGILALSALPVTFYMAESNSNTSVPGVTLQVTPGAGCSIFPFAPTGVTFSAGQTVFALY